MTLATLQTLCDTAYEFLRGEDVVEAHFNYDTRRKILRALSAADRLWRNSDGTAIYDEIEFHTDGGIPDGLIRFETAGGKSAWVRIADLAAVEHREDFADVGL